MTVALDALRVAIRWLHLTAAVAWVGGSLFYMMVLGPAKDQPPALRDNLNRRFRDLVQLAMATLVVTGAVITFDRLQLEPGPGYAITLGIKVALAVWMFVLAQNLASRGRRRSIERRSGVESGPRGGSPSWLILALGLAILLLSDVLKAIGPG